VGAFIFEEILCRWGALEEIVTDNGGPFVKALEYLAKQYRIHHIRISPYNSRANGSVERAHQNVRDALFKSTDGDMSRWPSALPSVIWAERVTVQRCTRYTPYYIAHGVDPLFPFDLAEATYMAPPQDAPISTAELLGIRARQLQRREEDLAAVADRVLRARQESVAQFVRNNAHNIQDFDFKSGALVLVRNSSVEMELDKKSKPRFFGPMVVTSP
jgi:transposase InsO family protein